MRSFALAVLLAGGAALAQTNYQRVQDEGVTAPPRPKLNMVGAGVSCADNAGNSSTDCTIVSAGTPAYATVQEEGTGLTARTVLNFVGGAITCIDDGSSKTVCTLALTPSTGGTGQTAAPGDDQVLVGNGTTYELKTLPGCASSSRLLYDTGSNSFYCSPVPLPNPLPVPATLVPRSNPLLLPCNAVRRANCR